MQKSWQKILPAIVSDDITPSPAENELLPLVRQLPGCEAAEEQEVVEWLNASNDE